MAYGIKNSLITWWILLIISVFLWFRNYEYDRMMASLAFTIALIQLVEYGIFNNMNNYQGYILIFIILWLVILILSLSVLVFTKNIISLIWAIIVSILFLFMTVHILTTGNNDGNNNGNRNEKAQFIQIEKNKLKYGYTIDDIFWVYIICFLVPFFILFSEIGNRFYLFTIIFYILASMITVYAIFGKDFFFSIWLYSLVGLFFLCWFIGMF